MNPDITPEQKAKYLKAIEKIENTPRPEKWRLIRNLTLELKPWYKPLEFEHAEACKELRLKNENEFSASKSGTMRNTMKMFGPVLTAMMKLDPDLSVEWSGKNKGDQEKIGKQLYSAFPEYRTARTL
jgi:hypothetical protein